jgi:nucleotidyltransferase substrate binding protein (TIGR01987 family)
MTGPDIRWQQRFANFRKALAQLTRFMDQENLNEMEIQGLIQSFEYNFELSWNTIKDFYEYQGETGIQGSRDAFRTGIERGLLSNGEDWMQMIRSRSLTVHTYSEAAAKEIALAIRSTYYPLFRSLEQCLAAYVKDPEQ